MIGGEDLALLGAFLAGVAVAVKPLGTYLANVMEGRSRIVAWARPAENALLRVCGADPASEMGWRRYALSVLVFGLFGALLAYALQRAQAWLPLNPQKLAAVPPDSALNTAVSFATNTDWQSYSGESTMSYLTQMAGLTVQNFASAATGIAVAFAFIRGLVRQNTSAIGNFWVDLYRATTYVLLPLSIIFSLVLVSQGVIQNLKPYQNVTTLDTIRHEQSTPDGTINAQDVTPHKIVNATTQVLPMGPVASQEAIKMIGTNGGGYFNANSAHPFENPTPLSDFLEMLAMVLIPAALCYAFGRMAGDTRQGWAVLGAMTVMFVVMALIAMKAEQAGNPLLARLGVDMSAGNMEGKEVRFGAAASALFNTISTATSCGATNSMLDSFTPLGGLIPMWLMQLGEVVFGGVGSGLYGMLIYAVLTVFIAGLMIGRTPEYLGKKIESFEMKMVSISILATPLLVLAGTALSVMIGPGKAGIFNPGPHGFSEVLYAFSSAANNNGSAFAGLSADTPYYNALLAAVMWLGRFTVIIPVLAMAGSLAAKKRLAVGAGTMPTNNLMFVVLLIGTVIMVGALTYFPALALGPIVEHLMLWK